MGVSDIIIIAAVVVAVMYVCIREYMKNKEEAKKTKKHLIREFFNHFGDTWNYKR